MVEYDPFSDQILDDPFPVYRQLRDEAPVYYVEGLNSWALSRFEDIWNAGADPTTFSSPGPDPQTPDSPDETLVGGSIFSLNPPTHTVVRKLLAPKFRPGGVKHLEPAIRRVVTDCIARVLPTGRCDVIGDLGLQLSVKVACLIIGLPLEDADHLAGIVKRFFYREPGVRGMAPDALAAAGELAAYLIDQANERKRSGHDRDDVLDRYCQLEIDGVPLPDEVLGGHLVTLVAGGTETLPKVIAGGVLQLHRHKDQRAELVANPGLIPDAFMEIVRYEMPTQFLTRRVAKDVELRGEKLRKGQGVMFLYRSANRDEREFDEPDRFDIHRRAPRIMSFGHGTHLCIGQHAARLEARVLLEELLTHMPEYDLDESQVVPARSEFVAGYLEMPITFTPRG